MGRIADLGNHARAWRRVRANKGSGGIDGETVAKFDGKAWDNALYAITSLGALFSNKKCKEEDYSAVAASLRRTFSSRTFVRKLPSSKANWLQIKPEVDGHR